MRRALIWSVVWITACLAVSAAVLIFVATQRIGGRMTSERASRYGSGVGVVTSIGLFPIWWFHYFGPLQARREAQAREGGKGRKSATRGKRKP